MKKLFITFFLLSIALLSSATFATVNYAKSKKKVDVLFIQMADKGVLKPIKNKPGFYELKLEGVKEYVQFFTDRPIRKAGIYPTDKFVQQWLIGKNNNSFNKVPPNAALSAIEIRLMKNKMLNTVLELSSPSYNSKQHTLTYIVQPLKGLALQISQKSFKNVALFIDDYCASCTGIGF